MNYKKGYTIKPYEVTSQGEVLFTDGTNNNLRANQKTCEAYGYRYDSERGLCYLGRQTTKVSKAFKDLTNNTKGGKTESGTENTTLLGSNNRTKGRNNNGFITGEQHVLTNGIDNASVLGGKMGKALRQGEVVVGGGSFDLGAGYTQSSKVQLEGLTVNEVPTQLDVQGVEGERINVQTNSILGFEIYVTRLETGGTSGVAGKFSYTVNRGAVRVDSTGAITIYDSGITVIAQDGVQGDFTVVDSTVNGIPSITIEVADRIAINNSWSATVYLHELRTNINI